MMANLINPTISQQSRQTYTGVAYAFNTNRIRSARADSTSCVFHYIKKLGDRREKAIEYKVSETYANIKSYCEDADVGKKIEVTVLEKDGSSYSKTEMWTVDDIVLAYADPSNASYTYALMQVNAFECIKFKVSHTLSAFMALANAVSAGEDSISTTTGITAYATGGQTNATQLDANYNDVTTVASSGDSVKLWTAAAGEYAFVKNNGANSLDLFPSTGDKINDLSTNAAYAIPPGGEVMLHAISSSTWETNEVIYARPTKNIAAIQVEGANQTTAGILSTTLTTIVSGQGIDIGYTTSDVEGDTDIIRITDSRNHDDAAADAYRGITIENSGNFPGTAASTTYLINAEYSGVLGASGALATLYGVRSDFSTATLTAGTYAAGYFSDTPNIILLGDGTNAIGITPGATNDSIDISSSATTSGSIVDINLDTSDLDANTTIVDLSISNDHDDAAADALRGVYVAWSGNLPGTNATTTLSLVDAVYSGTTGGGGANGVVYAVRGDVSSATMSAGTTAAGYFTDGTQTVTLANGTNAISTVGNIVIDGTPVTTGHLIDLTNVALTTGSIFDIGAITTKTSGYLYNGSMTTSTLDAATLLDDFSVSCNHDGLASDTLRGIRRTWSGDLPDNIDLVLYEGISSSTTVGGGGAESGTISIFGADMNATINGSGINYYGIQIDGTGITDTSSNEISGIVSTMAANKAAVLANDGTVAQLSLKDTSCTDSDDNITITASASDTGSGSEDVDITIQQQVNGAATTTYSSDADGDTIIAKDGKVKTGETIGDGNSPGYFNVKTLYYTIGDPTDADEDYQFTSQADKAEQGIQLGGGDIIPAYSRVLDVIVRCTEDFTGTAGDEAGLGTEIGNASGGAQYAASANVDDVDDMNYTANGGAFVVAPSSSASSVYISCTPTTNDWDELTAGKLEVYVTYIDNSVVS